MAAITTQPSPAPLTLFDLPTAPQEFGVALPPANLRRINFSALDYSTALRAIIEYIQAYFPNDFNDFVAHNGIVMIAETMAALTAKLSLRGDINANEATLPTAQTEIAVANHLLLIAQSIRRQSPAVTDIEISVNNPAATDIVLQPGTLLRTNGPDSKPVFYEVYRAPGDFTGNPVIPAGKAGVIAFGLEGSFASPVTAISPGGPNQSYTIRDPNLLTDPITVTVGVNSVTEDWRVTTDLLETFGPIDKVVNVTFLGDQAVFNFGDDITGAAPISGQTITFRYRTGGGSRGRITIGQLDELREVAPLPPANAPTSVRFRNVTPSSGGLDKETLDQAKKRAPRDSAVQSGPGRSYAIVTAQDYAQAATSFSHPVYGSVLKALATLRSGLNANLVEVYCLASGPKGAVVMPSAGLKLALGTFFSNLNVLTDHVSILDGAVKPVDLDMTVVINKNADATVVKNSAEAAISNFFAVTNWQLGQALYVSNLVDAVESVDGVAYVDVFQPVDNILASGQLGDPSSPMIGFDELIVEGNRKVSYFYEQGRPI